MADKLIPGKKYWVAMHKNDWKHQYYREYVGDRDGASLFKSHHKLDPILTHWPLVREIPEVLEHYTAETFPTGLVWISNTSTPSNHELVTGVYPEHIQFSNGAYLDYAKFGDDQLISTDRINWRKAVPESEGYTPVLGGGGSSTGYESVARGSGGGSIHGRRHDR